MGSRAQVSPLAWIPQRGRDSEFGCGAVALRADLVPWSVGSVSFSLCLPVSCSKWLVSIALLAALVAVAHTATSSLARARGGQGAGVDAEGRPDFLSAGSSNGGQTSLRVSLSSKHPVLSRADMASKDHA